MQTMSATRRFITSATMHIPVGPSNPYPKFCKDCRYFLNDEQLVKLGHCKKVTKVNLVDGIQEYEYASIARTTFCRGRYYEELVKNKPPPTNPLSRPNSPYVL